MKNRTNTIIFICFIIVLMAVFETMQQLFYINKFQPQLKVGFIEILKSQTIKWLTWLLFSTFVALYVKKLVHNHHKQLVDYLKLLTLILCLVFVDVFIISLYSSMQNDLEIAWKAFMYESLIFFTFQKLPIYTLGYIGFAGVMYFYYENMKLKIEVSNFGNLKLENAQLYKKLANNHDDKIKILKIKVGNTYKIIAVNNIYWLQADDYCVNVHMQNSQIYSLRKSLKSLENIMPEHFLRVHRGAIVNMHHIKEYRTNSTNTLILINGSHVTVSKSKSSLVKKFILTVDAKIQH